MTVWKSNSALKSGVLVYDSVYRWVYMCVQIVIHLFTEIQIWECKCCMRQAMLGDLFHYTSLLLASLSLRSEGGGKKVTIERSPSSIKQMLLDWCARQVRDYPVCTLSLVWSQLESLNPLRNLHTDWCKWMEISKWSKSTCIHGKVTTLIWNLMIW